LYRAQKSAVEAGRLHEIDVSFLASFGDLPDVQDQLRFAALQPRRYDVSIETVEALDISAAQAEAYGDLGNRPTLSITAPEDVKCDSRLTQYSGYIATHAKTALHKELARLSTRGRHIEIDGADHGTLIANPAFAAMVADEILKTVREAASG
jgi:hypothetical protein